MTYFIDLRATPSGGICADDASFWNDTVLLSPSDFSLLIHRRDIVLATHGFNVSREEGMKTLSLWRQPFNMPASALFIGVLWPGDSRFLPIMDYPFEGDEAIKSGRLLGHFINEHGDRAASISFVSHSLGARTVLEALKRLKGKARRLILMAGAIEDDCLVKEYKSAAAKAQEIYILASREDWVLEFAFPIGNPVGEIVMQGHPYFRTALGREGPAQPIPLDQRGGAWQIPDSWNYGHLDYLPRNAVAPAFPQPVPVPGPTSVIPSNPPINGWKASWSAGAVSTQLS